jgi:hypothetical protein
MHEISAEMGCEGPGEKIFLAAPKKLKKQNGKCLLKESKSFL